MPKQPYRVPNFWLSANIDSRAGLLQGGTRASDDGFDLTICQRNSGQSSEVLQIIGKANRTNVSNPTHVDTLTISIYTLAPDGTRTHLHTIETSR